VELLESFEGGIGGGRGDDRGRSGFARLDEETEELGGLRLELGFDGSGGANEVEEGDEGRNKEGRGRGGVGEDVDEVEAADAVVKRVGAVACTNE
jgi:hypothetical protein